MQVRIPAAVQGTLRRIGRIAEEAGTSAYAVGGCVRDWRLRIPGTVDLDVTVEGDGIAAARAVSRALRGTVRVHEQFGTATVIVPRTAGGRSQAAGSRRRTGPGSQPKPLRIDFASCRRETYAKPAAYPKVTAGTLEDDLVRRDFTINAMAVGLSPARFGALVDPFGGARDLRGKRLRILHPRSFLDDPSRVLRGVRFLQRFRLRWERETGRAAREAVDAGAISWLNVGRLQKELDRMAREPDPAACFRNLAALLGGAIVERP